MKRLKIAVVLVALGTSAWAEEIRVTVQGMVCSFCAQGIEKKFNAMPGVERVKVDLESKVVSLTVPADRPVDEKLIRKTIEDAGYTVKKIEHKAEKS